MRLLRKKQIFSVLGIIFCIHTVCFAADVTLAWDPNQEADFAGYGIYYRQGNDGPPYDLFGYVAKEELSDPEAPAFTITGLQQDAVYYFALTAFDSAGDESAFSDSVCAEVGEVVTPCENSHAPADSSAGASSTSSGGGSGGGCFLSILSGY